MNQVVYPGMTVYIVSDDISFGRVRTVQISITSEECVISADVSYTLGWGAYIGRFSAIVSLTDAECGRWTDKIIGAVAYNAADGSAMCYRSKDAESILMSRQETAKMWRQLRELADNAPVTLSAERLEQVERAVEMVKGVRE